jgi:hypothetical protein
MLETRIEELTAAVIELTAALGAMQAPRPEPRPALEKMKAALEEKAAREQVPNDQPSSTDTTSGEPSAPTGESSSPALDYVKDVKPITIQLSKEKGREITIGVLSRFGVKSAQDLDPAQWADYIAHCGKVLAGGEV